MEFRRVLFRSKDDAGFPIYAADLHQSWRFRGGPTAADIYRRLRTGLDGTPMPSFSDLIDQKFLTDEQLWRLPQYRRSLSPPATPGGRGGVHAAPIAGPLPAAPAASGGGRAGPSRGPCPPPRHIPDGMERPYFLMGAATDPVYQWRWTSQPRRAVSGLARGIDQFDALPSAPAAQAVYDHGEWRVVFTRALATPDTANDVQLATGRAIPVAFFAWDGSDGERGSRMAVSTWYFLALDRPTPASVVVSPLIAMVVTLGLGMLVIVRAQRRGGQGGRGG